MRKKQIDKSIMDQIEFGLSIGYFEKVGMSISNNPKCTIPFHDFNRRYKEYCR